MSFSDIIAADLGAVFDDVLSVPALHVNGAVNETLNVFFDRPHSLAMDDRSDVSSELPSIVVNNADMTNVSKQSVFTIDSTAYNVFEIQPKQADGTNRILLSEVDA